MQIQIHNLYPTVSTSSFEKKKYMQMAVILLAVLMIAPFHSVYTEDVSKPYEQDFVLTAYYSPMPDQCCYVKGGLVADRVLNGDGHTAADGTKVYPGLIAAPGTYPFGTVIYLPGYGTFKVHDRGGAIQEWDNGKHRLDLWVGEGEEGLARALQLGLKEVRGTVYLPGTKAPEVNFNFDTLTAPITQLQRFLVNDNLLTLSPKVNETGLSVSMLQEHLFALGYLKDHPTGFFGEKTQEAYTRFLADYHISAPSDALTKEAAAVLLSAVSRKDAVLPLNNFVNATSASLEIIQSKRLLRSLGYYSGRTNGEYNDALKAAILHYQQDHKLVGTATDPGAGQIGPITKKTLQASWNRALSKNLSRTYILFSDVEQKLKTKNVTVESFAAEGSTGPNVKNLQLLLADLGYFNIEDVNGNFGQKTKAALQQFQIDKGIIPNAASQYAGILGPKTLISIQREQSLKYYYQARGFGLTSLQNI